MAIKIGLMGMGGMGTVHYNNYAQLDSCAVTAAVGVTERDHEKGRQWGVAVYPDPESMLERESVDLVDVCTPTFTHKQHVSAALKAKKHVICEKPLALTRSDAQALFDLADENGVQLYVAQVL